ncbi:MAG: hypothetical protein AB7F59_14565 [Bdellovibrionales bacterium]
MNNPSFMTRSLLFFLIGFVAETTLAIPSQDYWIPQTRTLVKGEVKFDLGVYQTVDKSTAGGHQSIWGLSTGVWESNDFSAELGFDWNEPTYDTALHAISTHGKLAYQQVDTHGWAVAFGFDHFAMRAGYYDYNVYYLAFQNKLGSEWITEIGGFAGNEPRIRTASGAFVGAWKRIQEGEGSIGIEWMSGQGRLGYLTPGIRMNIRDGVEGVLSYGISGQRDQHLDLLQTRISVYF